jgi:uncharacterized membrane-anchored protein
MLLMKTKLFLLTVVLALQTAWVVGTVAVQERALSRGKLVMLETRPVDPRDLLRGDYVILNYEISNLPVSAFSGERTNAVPAGETIYVLLHKRGEFHSVLRASTRPLVPGSGEVLLLGVSRHSWNDTRQQTTRVEYGLERYYVSEGTGNPTGKLPVQVAVPASGQGIIKQVFVDGVPYAQALKKQAE